MKKEPLFWILGAVLMLAFIGVMLGVLYYDVKPIGPDGSSIGFSSLNEKFRDKIGKDDKSYLFSKYLGYCGILVVLAVGCQGLMEIVREKSLKALKPQVILFGVFTVVMLAFYVLFEKFPVNYRPILVGGELDPAFPSSHTLLAIYVFIAAAYNASFSVKTKVECTVVWIFFSFFAFISVFTRVLSGYHWLSDVVASILLGLSLVMFYIASCIHVMGLDNMEEEN